MLTQLINARVWIEQGGYRAPSCLVVTTDGLQKISTLTTTFIPESQAVLPPAHIKSLHRVDQLENPVVDVEAYVPRTAPADSGRGRGGRVTR